MKALIYEGQEELIDSSKNEGEEKYIYIKSAEEHTTLLELMVELRNDSSKQVLIVASSKYFPSLLRNP